MLYWYTLHLDLVKLLIASRPLPPNKRTQLLIHTFPCIAYLKCLSFTHPDCQKILRLVIIFYLEFSDFQNSSEMLNLASIKKRTYLSKATVKISQNLFSSPNSITFSQITKISLKSNNINWMLCAGGISFQIGDRVQKTEGKRDIFLY